MAEEQSGQQRTERATPRRREDARKRGMVARSMEVNTAAVLIASLSFFYLARALIYERFADLTRTLYAWVPSFRLTPENIGIIATKVGWAIAISILPFLVLLFAVGILANVGQFGFLLSTEALKPKLDRINPLSGFKRLFSMRETGELVKALLKLGVVGYIGYTTVQGSFPELLGLSGVATGAAATTIAGLLFAVSFRCIAAFVVLAVLDTLFQRYVYERQIMMTKQEVQEEMKHTEGNPHIKSRIRSLQRQTAMKRMMEKVPQADVVITNPTRLAIAVAYDPETMKAPRVVAKGARLVARRIIEIARQHHIPIVENKPLARSLFKLADVGESVPVELYQAIAEILAYVYHLHGRWSRSHGGAAEARA